MVNRGKSEVITAKSCSLLMALLTVSHLFLAVLPTSGSANIRAIGLLTGTQWVILKITTFPGKGRNGKLRLLFSHLLSGESCGGGGVEKQTISGSLLKEVSYLVVLGTR